LIDWCFTARQHKKVNLCQSTRGDYWLRRLRIANDKHTKTYSCMQLNIHTQRHTTGMSYLPKDKQCIQKITRPRMGKKRKPACNTLSIMIKKQRSKHKMPFMPYISNKQHIFFMTRSETKKLKCFTKCCTKSNLGLNLKHNQTNLTL